ncbi:hypothetical protein C8R43DRAFT_949168 [Mycena crocata]|nr:hypothetical protein C8R43DRAFT_949168 [Mycena crocata]
MELAAPHKRVVQPRDNHIAKLPDELTDDSLHREIAPVKDDWLELIKRREELAQVCLQWWTTIDTSPHFWDTLAVHLFMNSEFITRSVQRVKFRHLTIRLFLSAKAAHYPTKLSFTRPPSRKYTDFMDDILPCMALIFPRAWDLHLETEDTSEAVAVMNLLASYGLPSTRKAAISSRFHSSILHEATGNAIDMPRLSTLSLTLLRPLSFGTMPFSNLTAFRMKCFWSTPPLVATHFVQALGAATRLKTLDLDGVQCTGVAGTAAASLPAVTELKLTYMRDECAQVVALLKMPSLDSMRVDTCLGSSISPLFTYAPKLFSAPTKVVLSCDFLSITEMRRAILPMKRVASLDLGMCYFQSPDAFEELVLIPEFKDLPLEAIRLPHDVPTRTILAVLSVSQENLVLTTTTTPAGTDGFRWKMQNKTLVKEYDEAREEIGVPGFWDRDSDGELEVRSHRA